MKIEQKYRDDTEKILFENRKVNIETTIYYTQPEMHNMSYNQLALFELKRNLRRILKETNNVDGLKKMKDWVKELVECNWYSKYYNGIHNLIGPKFKDKNRKLCISNIEVEDALTSMDYKKTTFTVLWGNKQDKLKSRQIINDFLKDPNYNQTKEQYKSIWSYI